MNKLPTALKFIITSFFLIVITIAFSENVSGQFRVTIKLNLAQGNSTSKDSYFLTSEYNKWEPADSNYLFKKIANIYQLSFDYKSKYWLQYKITRGSNESVESDSEGYGINNRLLNVTKDTTVYVQIKGWKDLITKKHTYSRNVKILSDSFPIKTLNRKRQVWIYLPPSYNNSRKKFPVIYMQDGSELFDRAATDDGKEWKLDEKLDSLYAKNKTEVIVVGIASDQHREMEYSPYASVKTPKVEGVQYLDFLSNELVPYINHHYRTKTGPDNTAIGGSSMGGLISLYAILHYPNIFGSAAVFSPAYWNSTSIDMIGQDIINNNKNLRARIFLYGGDSEGVSSLPSTITYFKDLFLKNPNNSVKIEILKGGRHQIPYWTKPFGEFACWISK